MATIEFEFNIGDKVKIKDVNLDGRITSLYYGDTGEQYRVSYYWDGNFKSEYFYGFLLELLEESSIKKFGFQH